MNKNKYISLAVALVLAFGAAYYVPKFYASKTKQSSMVVRLVKDGVLHGQDIGYRISADKLVVINGATLELTNNQNKAIEPHSVILLDFDKSLFNDPFDLLVDLKNYFHITEKGTYTLVYGGQTTAHQKRIALEN